MSPQDTEGDCREIQVLLA